MRVLLAGLAAVSLAVVGCGSDDDGGAIEGTDQEPTTSTAAGAAGAATSTTTGAASSSGSAVTVETFSFRPAKLSVAKGTTVTWTNRDDILHTVTSGTPGAADGRFDMQLDGRGSTASTKLEAAGTYRYFCQRHPSMTAEVQVA